MAFVRGLTFGFFWFAVIFLAVGCVIPPSEPPPPPSAWLSTSGNHIVRSDGTIWMGRGANLHDTRSCGSGTYSSGAPFADNADGVAEVMRRIDLLTDDWRANFIRLALESRRTADNYLNSAAYRGVVKQMIDHIGTKPGVYVLVSVWLDTSFDEKGIPTAATQGILDRLARDFHDYPYVMFGVSNEPESNFGGTGDGDGKGDAYVWERMNSAVAAIRAAEDAMAPQGATPYRHLVAVQGTRDWGRDLDHYVTRPIVASGGANVIYETHVYNAPTEHGRLFLEPGKTLPVIIGEFGPVSDEWHQASVADMQILIDRANAARIPYLAWTFHHYCPPNLIGGSPGMSWDQNTDSTGIGIPLHPTDFGQLLRADLRSHAL